ncbi:unnamed protein product [Schistosoma mansoni]|uniref:Smp_204650 n=1 Tax=Schistosoma mansoni TaxID=6183 RepID=UPI00022C8504|nr:unnamed protein product [Schistosoma mansoni]|eukprot:XP_018646507.1 unnamed protein product [Schistosoma mansoni]
MMRNFYVKLYFFFFLFIIENRFNSTIWIVSLVTTVTVTAIVAPTIMKADLAIIYTAVHRYDYLRASVRRSNCSANAFLQTDHHRSKLILYRLNIC